MGKYGRHGEQCYRQNFGRLRSKSLNWLRFNVSLALRYFGSDGREAIAIDPSYISKSGKKTPHIGRFWSGCAGAVGEEHGRETEHRRKYAPERPVHLFSNKDGHGKKGTLIAAIRGSKASVVVEHLMKIPEDKRMAVKEVTMDYSDSMYSIVT